MSERGRGEERERERDRISDERSGLVMCGVGSVSMFLSNEKPGQWSVEVSMNFPRGAWTLCHHITLLITQSPSQLSESEGGREYLYVCVCVCMCICGYACMRVCAFLCVQPRVYPLKWCV